jgi:hypothetical protein
MARRKGPFDAVQFTRESAERIAGVVRQAELTPPAALPLTFERVLDGRNPKQVRAATFSGAWPIGSSKVVTFKHVPTATANVVNLSWPITLTAYSNEDCIVGKEGTNWWLVVPRLEARTAIVVTQTQQRTFCSTTASRSVVTRVSTATSTISYLTDVSIDAGLNTADCSISLSVEKMYGSAALIASVSVETSSLTVVSATATAVFIQSHFTSQFLRIRVP